MIHDIPRLIDIARTWTASECASSPVGAHQTIEYLATALAAERKRAEGLLVDLDARFEHSDHTAAKYYRRMRKAEREMHARELHHFESEQAMREALELIQPSRLMDPSESGHEGTTRDVIRARAILTRALNENGETDGQH